MKPENILISHDHAVVADFGIAKALVASRSNDTMDGTPDTADAGVSGFGVLVGTPAYMAPEQTVSGAVVDYRADLYAWGVVAYEVLSGRHPFGRKAHGREYLTAHVLETPRSLREVTPAVPKRCAALVMRCLAKLPASRPASANVILAELDVALVTRDAMRAPGGAVSRRRFVRGGLGAAVALAAAGMLAPIRHVGTTRVVGAGDPRIDVRAVQKAVDRSDTVLLEGHFSFDTAPTKPVAPILASGWNPSSAEVLVSREVTVSGVRDERGQMATIEGGMIPFYVNAPGSRVTIRGVRFVRPVSRAILVTAVRGLEISSSRIDGVVFYNVGGTAISLDTRGQMPLPSSPGEPEDISGHVVIAHNEIDAAGVTTSNGISGLVVFSAGKSPNREVDLDIIGNHIRNTTGSAINIRHISGRARVLGNTIQTSAEVAAGDVDAVRLVNGGSFLMANNTIECRWPNAAAITVFSPFAEWPVEHAVVEDNDVLMAPPDTVYGDNSAGITIKGFAHGVVVRHNTIRGRARSALAMYPFRGGVPFDNAFIDNRLEGFDAADVTRNPQPTKARPAGTGDPKRNRRPVRGNAPDTHPA